MKITIFTPTYNRAYIIPHLYMSLKKQQVKDFEWLIIDDGSIDYTESLVMKWITLEKEFPIRYYKQKNGGKCRAINRALDLAQGELFFTVDSDDYLTDDAIKKIIKWENSINDKTGLCAIAGNLGTTPYDTPNFIITSDYFEGTALDRYRKMNGERAIVFYTAIHRRYKYPEFKGENFMTEAVAWNRMANDGYKIRFYNDIICVYEYREDGLTKSGNRLFINNPRGYGLWLREKAKFGQESLLQKLKMIYTFTCDLASKYKPNVIAECISAPRLLIEIFYWEHAIYHRVKKQYNKIRKRKNESI